MFQKISSMERFMAYRRGITFLRRKLLVSQWLNFCGEPFNVSEILGHRKALCIIGGYHDFPSEFFLSHCAEKICRAPSLFDRISGLKFFFLEGDHGYQSGGGGG